MDAEWAGRGGGRVRMETEPEKRYEGRYRPLIALLTATEANMIACTFAEIERLTGKPLAISAQTDATSWVSPRDGYIREWRAMGWRARLDRERRRVEWRRIDG